MKKILVLCALLTGCGGYVNQASIDKAMELCATNEGLKVLTIFAAENAVCNNGAEFTIDEWKVAG